MGHYSYISHSYNYMKFNKKLYILYLLYVILFIVMIEGVENMKNTKKKKNIFLILLSPFIYFCLGCYYTFYALVYPFIFIYNLISSFIYKSYANSKNKKEKQEVIKAVNLEMDSIDDKIKKNNEIKQKEASKSHSTLKVKKENKKINKKINEKKLKERDLLISEINKQDSVRTEYPNTYRYTARDSEGHDVVGYLVAYTKQEVFNFLESEGYTVFKLENNKFIELLYGQKSFSKRKLKTKDLIFWLTQLSTYLKSSIPLTDAMRILGIQMGKRDQYKKRLFDAIVYQLIMGESFSDALLKQGSAFPSLLINMIKAAEATGDLEATLDDMAEYYNEIESTRKQMISALTYPTAVMIFSIAVVTFILLYVVPQFSGIYESAGVELNGLTLFVMSASDFLKNNIMYILIVIVVIIIYYLYTNVKSIKYALQKFAMKLPLFGKIIIYNEMTIFTKTFSSLLKNNVFITDSMEILTKITNNEIYKEIMFNTINNIAVGEKISTSFKDNWAIPEVAYYMIVTGESTGELAEMMAKVSLYYQEEHKNIINSLKSLIEPIMIIFLAVVVGGVVLSVIIPMFSLYGQIS